MAPDSEPAKEKERQIYHYEIEHLPQAAIWTATSFIFNIATQKLAHKHMHGGHDHGHSHGLSHSHEHDAPLWAMAGALLGGKLFSTGLVVGARAAFPDKAHRWDDVAARTVFAPATKAAAPTSGPDTGWRQRVKEDEHPAGQAR